MMWLIYIKQHHILNYSNLSLTVSVAYLCTSRQPVHMSKHAAMGNKLQSISLYTCVKTAKTHVASSKTSLVVTKYVH